MRGMFDKAILIDIETDGLDREKSRILKVEALKIDNGKVSEKYESFAYVGHTVDAYIKNITGVTEKELETAPQIDIVLCELAENCKGRVIIGFNLEFVFDFVDRDRPKNAKFGQNRIDLGTLCIEGRYLRKREIVKILGAENDSLESIAEAITKLSN